jgi:hypothetical protein
MDLMRDDLELAKTVGRSREIREQVLRTDLNGGVPLDVYSCLY